ncbi:MAG: hypothetical protein ACI4XA_04960 [Oscillospiraceae bacterium]
MTAQSSAAKPAAFAKFGAYFTYKLRFLRPNLIMNSILSLLSYPLAFALLIPTSYAYAEYHIVELAEFGAYSANDYDSSFINTAKIMADKWGSIAVSAIIVAMVCLFVLFVFNLVTTVRGFRYLYDKSYLDMDLSLPINMNTRFCADSLAVLSVSAVPHLLAIIVGMILMNFVKFDAFYSEWAEHSDIICQYMFVGLFSCIMLVGLTILMLSFCGKKAEAYIYPVVINIAIPLIHSLCIFIVESNTYGAVMDYSHTAGLQMGVTSPIGMLLASVFPLLNGIEFDLLPIFLPEYGIPALVITAAFFAAAYFLIKMRRSERVGEPYVFGAMNYIIPGIVTFAVALPICWQLLINIKNGDSFVGVVIGLAVSTFILYVIMELISGKAFRKFHITAAKWAATVGVSLAITSLLFFSNGFGMAYYVPSENEVARVSLQLYRSGPDSGGRTFTIRDSASEDVIRLVIGIHDDIPKDGEEDIVGASGNVTIDYVLKNGSTLSRSYSVPSERFNDLLGRAITPETWYDNETSTLEYCRSLGCESISSVNYPTDDGYAMTDTPGLTTEAFLEAYRKDCEKVSAELLYSAAGQTRTDVGFVFREKVGSGSTNLDTSTQWIWVYSWMDNTIELLREYGVEDFFPDYLKMSKSAYIVKFNGNNGYYSWSPEDIIALSEGVENGYEKEYGDSYKYYYSFCDWYSFGKADIGDSRVRELVEKGSCIYSPLTVNGYMLLLTDAADYNEYMNNSHFSRCIWIAEEYYDLAESVYRDYYLPESEAEVSEAI